MKYIILPVDQKYQIEYASRARKNGCVAHVLYDVTIEEQ